MARGGFLPLSRHSFVPVTRKNSPKKEFVKIQKFFLTNPRSAAIIIHACSSRAGIAQLVEQLICNQQVGGSSPSTSSTSSQASTGARRQAKMNMGEFPSGQRGQTVNLLSLTSMVRIHLPPPNSEHENVRSFCIVSQK